MTQNNKQIKIAVAMSGGVDSSVSAVLAIEKYGKENVFGVTMKLFCYGDSEVSDKNCCSLDAITDAATVCSNLGIRHYIIDVEDEFKRYVIDDFVAEYQSARTPNPCVNCNKVIKFKILLDKVSALGADTLVTGHYAKVVKNSGDGLLSGSLATYALLRGADYHKDQSYFLYNLTQDQLARVWFPLGGISKTETRQLAESYGLKTAHKAESQDICFVTDGIQNFLNQKITLTPGDIVDSSGKIYGRHLGLPLYTIGQRKGLGGGFGEPMFVVGLDQAANRVIIGSQKELYKDSLWMGDIHWVSGFMPPMPLSCSAKIRYNAKAASCQIDLHGQGFIVRFDGPQLAITPGQSVVFYDADVVVGGGIISSA